MSRIFPIIALLIAVGLFFAYIHPTYTGTIAEMRTQAKNYDKALAAAEIFEEKKDRLQQDQNAIPQTDRERVEAFLPDGIDNVQLILDLNALALRSGIRLSDFDIAQDNSAQSEDTAFGTANLPLESDSLSEHLTLSVSATGSYTAFRTFLAGVENSLRLLDVESIELADSATGVYTYQLAFRIYWLR